MMMKCSLPEKPRHILVLVLVVITFLLAVSSYSLQAEAQITLKSGEVITGEIIEHVLFDRIVLRLPDNTHKNINYDSLQSVKHVTDSMQESTDLEKLDINNSDSTEYLPARGDSTSDTKPAIETAPSPSAESAVATSSSVEALEASDEHSAVVQLSEVPELFAAIEKEAEAYENDSSADKEPVLAEQMDLQRGEPLHLDYSFMGVPLYTYYGDTYRITNYTVRNVASLFSSIQQKNPRISQSLIDRMDIAAETMRKGRNRMFGGLGLYVGGMIALGAGLGDETEADTLITIGAIGSLWGYIQMLRSIPLVNRSYIQTNRILTEYQFLYTDYGK